MIFPDLRYISSLTVDTRYLYAGTPGGSLRYDKLLAVWVSGPKITGSSLLASDPYSGRIYFARGNSLYGLFFFSSSSPAWIRDFQVPISAIGYEPDYLWVQAGNAYYRAKRLGMVWASLPRDSTANRAIQWQEILSNDTFRQPEYAFLSPLGILGPHHQYYPISALAKEPISRDLWVGTWGGGLYRYPLGDWKGQQIRMGSGVDDVRAIVRDGTTLWFGGYLNEADKVAAITSYQTDSNRWEHFEAWWGTGLVSTQVTAIAVDSQFVFFATDRGLARFEKKTRDWHSLTVAEGLPNEQITSLAMAQGRLWIGTAWGMASLVPSSNRIEREEDLGTLPINHIAAVGESLFAATSNGLFLRPKANFPWTAWRSEDGVLDFNTVFVLPESAGVWVASERGLEFYHRALKVWERHPEMPFLPGAEVYAMASDRTNLWMGTDRGALQYDKGKKFWRVLTTADGLPDNRVNALLLDGRYLWFGTALGAARYQWQ